MVEFDQPGAQPQPDLQLSNLTLPELARTVLSIAMRQHLIMPNADEGIALIASESGLTAPEAAWHEAVAAIVSARLAYDPVRLLPGSLQCHWHLALTPEGVAAARALALKGGAGDP